MRAPIIAPSIMAADVGRLGPEAQRLEAAGADWLHVDIMDGHFVPNFTFGPATVEALRRAVGLPLDVHLMLEQPDRYVEVFAKAGATTLLVHAEARHDVGKTLGQIRALGCRAGLVVNPPTPLEKALPYFGQIDQLLCMTVNPGFGGQKFIPEVLEKVRTAARLRAERGFAFQIEVDGGIDANTAGLCAQAGAEIFAAGTSLVRAPDAAQAIETMRSQAAASRLSAG